MMIVLMMLMMLMVVVAMVLMVTQTISGKPKEKETNILMKKGEGWPSPFSAFFLERMGRWPPPFFLFFFRGW